MAVGSQFPANVFPVRPVTKSDKRNISDGWVYVIPSPEGFLGFPPPFQGKEGEVFHPQHKQKGD
jgi:hypothetical protein